MFVCCTPRGSHSTGGGLRVPELLLPDHPTPSNRRFDNQIHGYVSVTPTSGYRQREKVVITPRAVSSPPLDVTHTTAVAPQPRAPAEPLLRRTGSADSAPRLAAIAEESTTRAPSEQQVDRPQISIASNPPPPPPPAPQAVIEAAPSQVASEPPPPAPRQPAPPAPTATVLLHEETPSPPKEEPPTVVEPATPPSPSVDPHPTDNKSAAALPPSSAPPPPPPSSPEQPVVIEEVARRDPKSDEPAPPTLQLPLPQKQEAESPQAVDAPVPMSEKEFRSRVGSLGVPSKDPETLTNPSPRSTPKSKASAKKPPPARGTRGSVPNAKAAGGTGLRTRDRNKMVDILDEREKKDILRICHFARETIEIDPAADASVCERDAAFMLAALLFAVKLEAQGKQNPVSTAIAHMVDQAEGDIPTAKAKKAAPKVAFLLRRVAEPLINALRTPDLKHDAEWVARDLRDTASVMMGDKPPGLKERMPYLESALENWTYKSLLQAAKDDLDEFEKLRLALVDAFDDCRKAGTDLGAVQDAVSKIESVI